MVFDLATVGTVLRFDLPQFVLRLAVGISLLTLATYVTETIGYRLLLDRKTQKMLYNKGSEVITETSEFAELGMKAAIAAAQFSIFGMPHSLKHPRSC